MSATTEEELASSVEIHVLTIKECFLYKVPPLKSASGHRAEEWGLENPLFTGCLQVFQADRKLRIALYTYKDQTRLVMDAENVAPFGQCPIEIKPGENVTNFVDGVIDSSRYYAVRLKDPKSSRWAWIGVGFRDRETAFDFKTALNEYIKYIDRSELASKLSSVDHLDGSSGDGGADDDDETRARKNDHRAKQQQTLLHLEHHIEPLKEGEKIKVNIKSSGKSNHTANRTGGGLTALKPPPLPGATVFGSVLPPPSTVADGSAMATPTQSAAEDDDWGDFVSTNP